MPCQNLQTNLNKFSENFRTKKSIREDTALIYVFENIHEASRKAFDANILIDRMRLPLVAICKDFCNYFTVQSNETEV